MNISFRGNKIGGARDIGSHNQTITNNYNTPPRSLFDMLSGYINHNIAYDSSERYNEGASICQEHTRIEVLEQIEAWAQDEHGLPVCWLSGPAGSGKSTISQTIAERSNEQNRLAFSYFFSRRNPDRNDMSKFFPTFAYQLSRTLPLVQVKIQDALASDPSILRQRLPDQIKNLIVTPVRLIPKPVSPMIIVVDGLDEYNPEAENLHLEHLIPLLVHHLPHLSFRLLFASRPEAYIEEIFSHQQVSQNTKHICLQDFPARQDVFNYLKKAFSEVQTRRTLSSDWVSDDILWHLADKSEGIFVYASTLVKFVGDEYHIPQQRLQVVMRVHKGLDSLFRQVLMEAKEYANFKQALSAIVFLRTPLSIGGLVSFFQVESVEAIRVALRGCLSILQIPEQGEDYIRPYHASLLDFLSDPGRARSQYLHPLPSHLFLLGHCIKSIDLDLKLDNRATHYAYQNWAHHFHMALSALEADRVDLALSSMMGDFVEKLLPEFNFWILQMDDNYNVETLLHDLKSTFKNLKVALNILDYSGYNIHSRKRNKELWLSN